MTNSQIEILKKYFSLEKKMTLKKMSKETGIQMTRCFRLMNGSEMKLDEFEKIKSIVAKKQNISENYLELLESCHTHLSAEAFKEIIILMQTKYQIFLLKNSKSKQDQKSIA